MKKLFLLLLTAMMAVCLGACSASEGTASLPENDATDDVISLDIERTLEEEIIADGEAADITIQNDLMTRDYSQGLQDFTADYYYGDGSDLYFEYFDEFYGQLMYDGLPEGRTYIPLGYANGAWKYNLVFR